jgi:hypothetical protein
MIKSPTVLILGAGASIPYEYPSGEKLITNIYNGTDPNNQNHELYSTLVELGYSNEFINEFRESLDNSTWYSIDSFLEYMPKFRKIGKIAIASVIIAKERSSQEAFKNSNDNWYRHLFNSLKCPFDNFDQNELSIITFNYDRSLEQYLFKGLKDSYEGLDDNNCASKIEHIPIIHVHGKLDDLPWEYWRNGNKRAYGELQLAEDLRKASEGIIIIHESTENDKLFKEAYKLSEKAENI